MQKSLHQVTDQAARRIRRRKAEGGFTLPEILFALAIAGIGIIGAVAAYNAASDRMAANNLFAGIQAFNVDLAQYVLQFHQEQPGGVAESAAQASTVSNTVSKAFGASGTAIGNFAVNCLTASPCPAECGGGCGAGVTPANATVRSPNMVRLVNLPSLSFGEGPYDEDADDEWHIRISDTQAVEVAWVTQPDSTTPPTGFSAAGSGAIFDACPIQSTAVTPDTSVVFAMAIDGKSVCDTLAQSMERGGHVVSAVCYDDETTIEWRPPADTVDGDSVMVLCAGVR